MRVPENVEKQRCGLKHLTSIWNFLKEIMTWVMYGMEYSNGEKQRLHWEDQRNEVPENGT